MILKNCIASFCVSVVVKLDTSFHYFSPLIVSDVFLKFVFSQQYLRKDKSSTLIVLKFENSALSVGNDSKVLGVTETNSGLYINKKNSHKIG